MIMKRFKYSSIALALCHLLGGGLIHADDVVLSDADLVGAYTTTSYKRTSVHDPSIFIDTITTPNTPYYYAIGSHLDFVRSTNLSESWSSKLGGGQTNNCTLFANPSGNRVGYAEAYCTQSVHSVKNYLGEVVDFPSFDAHAWQNAGFEVHGNQWAPDVVYNPNMGKWLMYMSVNGDKWCSSIVCLSADKPLGPWVYQGPVVMSGFMGTIDHNGYTATDDWKRTDLEIATGYTSLPARYKVGESWGSYWPNCIDPCVFFDEEGELWMSYGSWSGGIWMLPLDKDTGLRDYTKQQPLEYQTGSDARNLKSDPYFGRKIAGGWYVSGEGSYIEHFGNYYYLFISYGFYSPDGGYEMRVFRSSNPDGPYVDCRGVSPLETRYRMNYGSTAAINYGMKLMGGYQWNLMTKGELSQGHNSAFTDLDGRSFVLYHTKFNDGTAAHELRLRQLFINQAGWPVCVPFEFHGETITQQDVESAENVPNADIPGTYDVILHRYNQDYANMEIQQPVSMKLVASDDNPSKGTVTNGMTGTWKRIAGTDFIEVTIDNVVYKGVLSYQKVDYSNIKATCISALSSNGGITVGANRYTHSLMMWASKADAKAAIAYTKKNVSIPVKANQHITSNLTLPAPSYFGTKVTWVSSNETVLSNMGEVVGNGMVELTITISRDNYSWSKSYPLQVGDVDAIDAVSSELESTPCFDLYGRPVKTGRNLRIDGHGKIIVGGK